MTALQDLRIVEIGESPAVSMAGMALADHGAEVIRIGSAADVAFPPSLVWHRGKRSVSADITTATGVARARSLLAAADGFLEDLGATEATRLGLDWETLHSDNLRLVQVSLSGFGERGPLASLPNDEALVNAVSGRMATHMAGCDGPVWAPSPVLSFGSAMLAVQGLLAGVRASRITGRGQRASTSMAHALVSYDMTSGHGHRANLPKDGATVYGVMPLAFMTAECSDGGFIQMCSRIPHLFRNWLTLLGLEVLLDDPALADMPDVLPSQQELARVVALIQKRMRQRSKAEWLELFAAHDVGGDPFLSPQAFLTCEQAQATGRVLTIIDPRVGGTRQIGPLALMSDTPARITTPAPDPGQDDGRLDELMAPIMRLPATGQRLEHPLQGLVFLECAQAWASPFAFTLLAEMGARVIKIEPPNGDIARRNWMTTYVKETPGKESVVADLKTPEGREIVQRIAAGADVFLHNFRPGVPERLGIDYETLARVNPRLVYVYGACYGAGGPWSHRPGFHSTPNAITGTGMLEAGRANRPQNRTFGDPAGALATATAIMTALHARERTGRGQYVETTMLASLAYPISGWSLTYDGKPADPQLDREQRGMDALHRLYPTAEGWLALSVSTPAHWHALTKTLESGNLAADVRFADAAARAAHDEDLQRVLEGVLLRRSAAGWAKDLQADGIAAARGDGISFGDFMLHDEHMRANGLIVDDVLPDVGRFARSNGSVEFAEMPTSLRPCVPLGSSTVAVLRELGYSAKRISKLDRDGITRARGNGLPTS